MVSVCAVVTNVAATISAMADSQLLFRQEQSRIAGTLLAVRPFFPLVFRARAAVTRTALYCSCFSGHELDG